MTDKKIRNMNIPLKHLQKNTCKHDKLMFLEEIHM